MKPRLHPSSSFKFRLGVMAFSVSLVAYPTIAKAEFFEQSETPVKTVKQDITQTTEQEEKISASSSLPNTSAASLLTNTSARLRNALNNKQTATKILHPAVDDTKVDVDLPQMTAKRQKEISSQSSKFSIAQTPSIAVKILTPTDNTIVDGPTTTVILQFSPGTQIELRVNGALVETSLIGRTETDINTKLVTQTWFGVSLKEGENTISAQVLGATEPPVTIRVVARGTPKQLTLETVEARIPADARSTATIRGELIDENRNRANQDAVVTLISTAGEFVGKDFKPDQPGFQVEAKAGQFTANLRSDLKAQTVRIQATTSSLEAFTQLQFETALRPSLVTGVIDLRLGARGTNYYGSFRDFLRPDENNKTQLDFHSAIFATGAIGEWLFTGAYNSSRSLNEDCNCDNRLFRTYQFNEQNYPVYGDSSRVDVITPSTDSVFLRLERSTGILGAAPDYAMWGDYNTEEFARSSQQFTAITRQLHGFKANYNLGNLQITGFYGNQLEGFQRDTIAPDGTSGYYFLSRRILLPGSENVFIELEELNRPGTVLDLLQN
ncbi:hypothetical protein [Nostoc sp. FACHB-888]|uniref:hypothetical protein n=1 Tax=Nostoc sp. FACHB-888 TaxID=2692842 RepID=UPI001F5517B1|nr:hypothetical protein [Nostoc sp. FACHB-888]